MTDPSMQSLAERLARGDEAAFAELYDACADRLHRYAMQRVGSRHTAADVVQNAFLRAVKSRRRFRGVENPVAYMFQIARNEAARLASRRKNEEPLAGDDVLSAAQGALSDGSDAEMVTAALKRLTNEDRELVELKIFGGLTFREIADVTQMPQATVATRYRRALESLRPWLVKQLR